MLMLSACTSAEVFAPSPGSTSDAGWLSLDAGVIDVKLTVDRTRVAPARPLLAKGHAFGGTVWTPFLSAAPLESHLVGPHRLGALRFSLQRLTENANVSQADFSAGLEQALEAMPELGLIERYEKQGGSVIFNFMATPSWLQDTTISPPAICRQGPNSEQLQWRPPRDLDLYATQVVAPIVAFFTKRFGPGQRYEVWNEPTTCTWYGTTEQYNALYAAVVKGARMADPSARIGGPSHSESVLSGRTINDPSTVTTPFVRRFIEASAHAGLPIDFVTLHSFNVNPASNFHFHEDQLATVRSWLTEFGYPGETTEIINDEWNYSVYEDTSVDNVNSTFVGAAFVGSTMLAFDEAGYDDQASQSYQDHENAFAIISPMFASLRGLPRAGYQVLDLLSRLGPTRVTSHSDNPWVRVVATDGPTSMTVVAAAFTPHQEMSLTTAVSQLAGADPSITTRLGPVAAQLRAYYEGFSATIPASVSVLLSDPQRATLSASKTLFDQERARRENWGVGPMRIDPLQAPGRTLTWRLEVTGLTAPPTRVLRSTINSKHALTQAQLVDAYKRLSTSSVPIACAAGTQVKTTLGASPVCTALDAYCASNGALSSSLGKVADCTLLEMFVVEFANTATMVNTQRLLTRAQASSTITSAFADGFAAALTRYQPLYDAEYQQPELARFVEDVTSQTRFDGGVLTLDSPAEPFDVSAFEIEK